MAFLQVASVFTGSVQSQLLALTPPPQLPVNPNPPPKPQLFRVADAKWLTFLESNHTNRLTLLLSSAICASNFSAASTPIASGGDPFSGPTPIPFEYFVYHLG